MRGEEVGATPNPGKGLRPLHPCFMRGCQEKLTSTHNSSGGLQAHLGGEQRARLPRAPTGRFASCTPIYEWIPGNRYHFMKASCTSKVLIPARQVSPAQHAQTPLTR